MHCDKRRKETTAIKSYSYIKDRELYKGRGSVHVISVEPTIQLSQVAINETGYIRMKKINLNYTNVQLNPQKKRLRVILASLRINTSYCERTEWWRNRRTFPPFISTWYVGLFKLFATCIKIGHYLSLNIKDRLWLVRGLAYLVHVICCMEPRVCPTIDSGLLLFL